MWKIMFYAIYIMKIIIKLNLNIKIQAYSYSKSFYCIRDLEIDELGFSLMFNGIFYFAE